MHRRHEFNEALVISCTMVMSSKGPCAPPHKGEDFNDTLVHSHTRAMTSKRP